MARAYMAFSAKSRKARNEKLRQKLIGNSGNLILKSDIKNEDAQVNVEVDDADPTFDLSANIPMNNVRTPMNDYVGTDAQKAYTCKLPGCNKVYKHLSGLRYHNLHGHINKKDVQYSCDVCDRGYTSFNGLKHHLRVKHEMDCPSARTFNKINEQNTVDKKQPKMPENKEKITNKVKINVNENKPKVDVNSKKVDKDKDHKEDIKKSVKNSVEEENLDNSCNAIDIPSDLFGSIIKGLQKDEPHPYSYVLPPPNRMVRIWHRTNFTDEITLDDIVKLIKDNDMYTTFSVSPIVYHPN